MAKIRHLRQRLIMAVLLTSSLVTTIITVVQLSLEYSRQTTELESLADGMIVTLKPMVSDLLWNIDTKRLAQQLHMMMTVDALQGIVVKDSQGMVVFEEHKNGDDKLLWSKDISFTGGSNEDRATNLGTMNLTFTNRSAIYAVFRQFFSILVGNIIKTAIVALILVWVFSRIVTRPLQELVGYIRDSSEFNQRPVFTYSQQSRLKIKDEISELTEYIVARDQALWEVLNNKTNIISSQAELIKQEDIEKRSALEHLYATQAKLREERAKAESTARLAQLGVMAGGVAHEINNPLFVIGSYADIFEQKLLAPSFDIDRECALKAVKKHK